MKKKIALVCMAKNEDYYLQEWIDYHLKLGFDSIHIFQNNWRFQNKIQNDNVFLHEYDGITDFNDEPLWIRNIQARCYTEFSQNYHNEYEWAAFFDVDEFLVLNEHNNVKEFISGYDKVDCLIVNWAMFGDNNLKDFDPNNCSVIERFTMRSQINHQFKSICKLHPEMKHQIHWIIGSWTDTDFNSGNNAYNYMGNYNVSQLNHYFAKTFPEFLNKVERGNACRNGVNGKRDISDFYENNFNDVLDLKAFNFYKK